MKLQDETVHSNVPVKSSKNEEMQCDNSNVTEKNKKEEIIKRFRNVKYYNNYNNIFFIIWSNY